MFLDRKSGYQEIRRQDIRVSVNQKAGYPEIRASVRAFV